MRPTLERKGKPIRLTDDETETLDLLWDVGQEIISLERDLAIARKKREALVREAKERRFLLREIAEIGSLSQAGVSFIVNGGE